MSDRKKSPRQALLGLAACLAAAPLAADQGGKWVDMSFMNLARQEVGAARIGDKIYVVGGLVQGPPTMATNTVEVNDIPTDTWSFVAPMPVALDHMGVVELNGLLWVIGGFSGDFQARDEVWIYDPASDGWSPGTPLPAERGGLWAVTYRHKIYVFGGVDGDHNAVATTTIYDPVADQWSQGADMPTAREHLTAVLAGEYVYAIGGRDGPDVAVNERYHPATDTWTVMTPMPHARSAPGAALFADRIYVAGGETPLTAVYPYNEVYDLATDSWHCQKDMGIPRHGLPAIPLDDRILFPAGGFHPSLGPVSFVTAFVPASMAADVDWISVTTGGTQTFDIHAGPDYAGDLYQVVGSLSGTSPGFAFGTVSVPLNFDHYLSITAGNPGLPPLAGAFGALDASGRATAAFTLAAGIAPSLAGLNAHHVFGVFDLTTLHFVSNPVVVEFVP